MNPYSSLPPTAFWSRSSGRNYTGEGLVRSARALLSPGDRVVSAGSCFAAELVPYLEAQSYEYVRTEYTNHLFREIEAENFSYSKFSAGYGNIYTARQLLQLVQRCLGTFEPIESVWRAGDLFIDPFRPGLRYASRSMREFELLRKQHLDACVKAFQNCDTLIFTLGLTEAWRSSEDGAVFPACPGTVAGEFDSSRHEFVNFSTAEVVEDTRKAIVLLRTLNSKLRIILTVSPVPLVATASGNHVVPATMYSKSVLRVAAEEIARTTDDVTYFPSYEIVTGPHLGLDRFEDNRRSVKRECVDEVMRIFFMHCDLPGARPAEVRESAAKQIDAAELSKALSAAECEEAMADAVAPNS